MGSTKIINVLKDDKFEEILDLFKNASAKEVIFVLPKKSRAFKDEEHFVILSNEAKKSDKTVSLLCSNPVINDLAKQYGFDVLMPKQSHKPSTITTVNQVELDSDGPDDVGKVNEINKNEDKDSDYEDEESFDNSYKKNSESDDNEPVTLEKAPETNNHRFEVITVAKIKRGLEEIIKPDVGAKNIKISQRGEKQFKVDIKRDVDRNQIEDIKKVWGKEAKKSFWDKVSSPKTIPSKFPKKTVLWLGITSLIIFGTIIYIATGSAKIILTPQSKAVNFQLKVTASDRISGIDLNNFKIPGQLFNIEKTANQTFPSTGEKDVVQKSRGKINVYNELGSLPQPLIATTRFESPDGLVFRTLKSIVVPGAKVVNGKIVPGIINVEVIADKPGQTYNISATQFSILAFKEKGDLEKYNKIYGKSETSMSSGIIGKAKIVTESDFSNAKDLLTSSAKKEAEEYLKTQTSNLKIIDFMLTVKNPESTASIDETADNFTMTVSAIIKTIGIRSEDINELVKGYVEKKSSTTVIPEKLEITFDQAKFNEDDNALEFDVLVKGKIYSKINDQETITNLMGKNEKEIKENIKNIQGIASAKIILSPFWIKRVPKLKDRIKLDINYD